MPPIALAVLTAIAGSITSLAGSIIAASEGGDVTPWAQVGGTATAVGALAYVAKLLADGRLVAHPVAEAMQAGARREERLAELVGDSLEREADLRTLMLHQYGRQDGGK